MFKSKDNIDAMVSRDKKKVLSRSHSKNEMKNNPSQSILKPHN
jgi:hypothetical protein